MKTKLVDEMMVEQEGEEEQRGEKKRSTNQSGPRIPLKCRFSIRHTSGCFAGRKPIPTVPLRLMTDQRAFAAAKKHVTRVRVFD